MGLEKHCSDGKNHWFLCFEDCQWVLKTYHKPWVENAKVVAMGKPAYEQFKLIAGSRQRTA